MRLYVFLYILLIFLDLVTKGLMYNSVNFHFLVFEIVPHANYGLFLNFLRETSQSVRIVTLSASLGVLQLFSFALLYFISKKFLFLKLGIVFIISGVSANVIDRAYNGFVRDFISIQTMTYSFNVADICLVIGLMLVAYNVVFNAKKIWRTGSLRKNWLVNKEIQISFSVKLSIVLLLYFFTISVTTVSFLTVRELPKAYFYSFFLSLASITVIFIILSFLFSIYFTHRIVGPVMALERYIEAIEDGSEEKLKLREKDYFKNLENLSERIKKITQKVRTHEN